MSAGFHENLPLKTPSPGEAFIFYRHVAHVTQKVEKSCVFLRGKKRETDPKTMRSERSDPGREGLLFLLQGSRSIDGFP